MWVPNVEEQCPLMVRLQEMRNSALYVTFKSIHSSPAVQEHICEECSQGDTDHDTKGNRNDNETLRDNSTCTTCEPVYYYDIPLAPCLFSKIETQLFFSQAKENRIYFQKDHNGFDSFTSVVSPGLKQKIPVGVASINAITAIVTHALPQKFHAGVILQKTFDIHLPKNCNELVIIGVGYEDSSVELYVLDSGDIPLTSQFDSQRYPNSQFNETFLLLASPRRFETTSATCKKDKVIALSLANMIEVEPPSSTPLPPSASPATSSPLLSQVQHQDTWIPLVIVSGTEKGYLTLWFLQNHPFEGCNVTNSLAQLVPITLEQSLLEKSPITSVTIVEANAVHPSDLATTIMVDLLLIVTYGSGIAYQWKVRVPIVFLKSSEGGKFSTLDVASSQMGIISHRRRLWNPDSELGLVVSAQLCELDAPLSSTAPSNCIKFMIFNCFNGLLVLELQPCLKLILRLILTPPSSTPRCTVCLFNTSILEQQIRYRFNHNNNKANLDIHPQNILVAFDTLDVKDGKFYQGLKLISFFQDTTTNEWIVFNGEAVVEEEFYSKFSEFPFFKTMIFLENSQVLLAIDQTNQTWLALEEKIKFDALNVFGINLVFQPLHLFNKISQKLPKTQEIASLVYIPSQCLSTSIVFTSEWSVFVIANCSSHQLESYWEKFVNSLTSTSYETEVGLVSPRTDAITVLISLLCDVISERSMLCVSPHRLEEMNRSTEHVVAFCSNYLNLIVEKTEKKNETLIGLYNLLISVNFRFYSIDITIREKSVQNSSLSQELQNGEWDEFPFSQYSPSLFTDCVFDSTSLSCVQPIHEEKGNINEEGLLHRNKDYVDPSQQTLDRKTTKKYSAFNVFSYKVQKDSEYCVTTQSVDIPGWSCDSAMSIYHKLSDTLIALLISNAVLSVAEVLSFVIADTWLTTNLPESFPVLLSRLLSFSTDVLSRSYPFLMKCLIVLNQRVISNTIHLGSIILCQDSPLLKLSLSSTSYVEELEGVNFSMTHADLYMLLGQLLSIHRFKNTNKPFLETQLEKLIGAVAEEFITDYVGYYVWVNRQSPYTAQSISGVLSHLPEINQIYGIDCCIRLMLHLFQHSALADPYRPLYDAAESIIAKANANGELKTLELHLWKVFLTTYSWYSSHHLSVPWVKRVISLLETLPDFLRDHYETMFLTCQFGRMELLNELLRNGESVEEWKTGEMVLPVLVLPKLTLGLAIIEHSSFSTLNILKNALINVLRSKSNILSAKEHPFVKEISKMTSRVFRALAWFFIEQWPNYASRFISNYISSVLIQVGLSCPLYLRCRHLLKSLAFEHQFTSLKHIAQEAFMKNSHGEDVPCEFLFVDALKVLSQYEKIIQLDLSLNRKTVYITRNQWIQKKKRAYTGSSLCNSRNLSDLVNVCSKKKIENSAGVKPLRFHQQQTMNELVRPENLSGDSSFECGADLASIMSPQRQSTEWCTRELFSPFLEEQEASSFVYTVFSMGMSPNSTKPWTRRPKKNQNRITPQILAL